MNDTYGLTITEEKKKHVGLLYLPTHHDTNEVNDIIIRRGQQMSLAK